MSTPGPIRYILYKGVWLQHQRLADTISFADKPKCYVHNGWFYYDGARIEGHYQQNCDALKFFFGEVCFGQSIFSVRDKRFKPLVW